jgi:O-antigen/teichoic acid export membrane protein
MSSPRYLNGVAWAVVNAAVSVLLPLAVFVVFARTMSPELIGLVAMAVACTEILKTIGFQGLYEALLQQSEDRRRCHETAMFILLAAGAALFVVYWLTLAVFGMFMPSVAAGRAALGWIGLRIVLDLATVQPQAELAHRLSYRLLAIRGIIGNAIAGGVAIALVLLHQEFAGLVAYQVVQSAAVFLVSAVGTGAVARPRFDRHSFRRMYPEASLSSGVRLVAATINNMDQIIVAAAVGILPLTFFNLGKRIENTFITAVNALVGIVFQPLFARASRRSLDGVWRRAVATVAVVCGFPAAAFVVNSEPVIRLVFGERWRDAAAVAAVLALSGFVRASGFVPGAMMSVSRRNRDLLITSVASAFGGVVLVVATVHWGIVWCAAALLVKNAVTVVWMLTWLRSEDVEPTRIYFLGLVVPFSLMLSGDVLGRWLAGGVGIENDPVSVALRVAMSLVPAMVVTAGYFPIFLRAQSPAQVVPQRGS